MPLPDSAARAVAAANRERANLILRICDLLESWTDQPRGIPDVVPRAAAGAFGDLCTSMAADNELLLSYVDGSTIVAKPAAPASPAPS